MPGIESTLYDRGREGKEEQLLLLKFRENHEGVGTAEYT